MDTYTTEEIMKLVNDWSSSPHERLDELNKLSCKPSSYAEIIRDAHKEDLTPRCQLIDTLLNGESYKYIVTVTAKSSTTAKSFHTHLCKFLDRFFKILCRRRWKELKCSVSGYVSVEEYDRKGKPKPIHAHIVFNTPPQLGKLLITEVRHAAKHASEYPKNGIRVLHPRRTHACTIRRRKGKSLLQTQRATADYFTKNLRLHKKYHMRYQVYDYGIGFYRIALSKGYKIGKIL